jgi:acyl dehydratase
VAVSTGRITDVEVDRLRSRIGKVVTVREIPYLTEVTRDAIRHWALATGDRNQLFLDEAYAKASSNGCLIAPPTMLYAFSRLSIGYRGGLPGVHSMFGGSSWQWNRPIRLGERITAEVTFKDLIELPSRFAGRMFKQVSLVRFLGGDNDEIAQVEAWGMRTERSAAQRKGKYDDMVQERYTPTDLQAIAEEFSQEQCRGATPLYWEDVAEDSEIPGIVRGPYTATIAVAFEQAWGGLFIHAHSYWYDLITRHPALGITNEYGVPEPPEAVHWDSALARSVGVPAAYDYGPERISWMATMLTNWCGDQGRLRSLHCEIRRFNVIGDLTRCYAKVTGKTRDAGSYGTIDLDVWCQNQRAEPTVRGTAKVVLPCRG